MSITHETSAKLSPAHRPLSSRIAPYEFLLNDSPLIDDRFLCDNSWIPFRELDECDVIAVKPFNINASSKIEEPSPMLKRKRSSLPSETETMVVTAKTQNASKRVKIEEN